MDIHATEEQQIEAIKKWWKTNGSSVITGVLVALAVVLGWNYWNKQKEATAQQVSVAYEQILDALQKGDKELIESLTTSLINEYGDTPYASLAALALAKSKAEEGKHEQARERLQWVIKEAKQLEVKQLARLRLANLQYSGNQLDEALVTLNSEIAVHYKALAENLKGDIYAAKGEIELARSAYQSAMELGADQIDLSLVQMKMDDLGKQ